MKKVLIIAVVAAFVLVVFAPAGTVSADTSPQDKVIKTTTDSRGFERRHTEVDLMYETAKQFIEAKQYKEAAAQLEKVMEADGKRLDALHDLGNCYQQLEQWDKAAAAYKRAVDLHPDDERLLTNLGYYQMRAQDGEGALQTYQKILALDPKSYEGNRWIAYLYEKSGDNAKALQHYEAALAAKPEDLKSMGSMAKIYLEMGQKDKALAMYEKAIPAASPDEQPKLKAQLGKLYIEARDFQKSAQIFGDLVAINPDSPANQYNLGVSYIQIGHAGEAIPHLEKAIELKPDFCLAYQQLANACNEAKNASKALSAAQSGLGKCSDRAAALNYQKGRALERLQRYDEAINAFQAAANDPTWGPAAKKQIQRQMDLIKRAEAMGNR